MKQIQPIDPFQNVSDTTPAPEQANVPIRLRWSNVWCNKMFLILTLSFLSLFGAMGILIVKYNVTLTIIDSWRPITYFAFAFLLLLIVLFCINVSKVVLATKGRVTEKPFERCEEFVSCAQEVTYETMNTNGKWHLIRLFGGEVLEMGYQYFTFTYFRCAMSSSFLAVYTCFMLFECIVVVRNLLPLKRPIGLDNKNQTVLLDCVMEIFQCVYPLAVLNLVDDIPIAEMEMFQIIGFPCVMLVLKLQKLWGEQVVLVVYNQGIVDDMGRTKYTAQEIKKHRRTSFALRESSVSSLQNHFFPRRARIAVIFFATVMFVVYFYSGVVLIGLALFADYDNTMQHCLVHVPLCDNGFVPSSNCASLRSLKTTFENQQNLVDDAASMTAMQIFKVSGVHDLSQLSTNPWPRIKEVWVFNSPIVAWEVDVSSWSALFRVRLFNLSNLTYVHPSLLSTTSFDLRIQECEQFVCPAIQNPTLRAAILSNLKGVVAKNWKVPSLIMVMLQDVNLTTVPEFSNDLISLNVAMNPYLDGSTLPQITNYIDVRGTPVPSKYLQQYENLPFKYGYGDTCPSFFNCSGFCRPRCIGYSSTVCLPTCMGGNCGVPAPCAAIFEE